MMLASPLLAFVALIALVNGATTAPTTATEKQHAHKDHSCQQQRSKLPKAIYMMTNKKPNSIVAISVGSNGKLAQAKLMPTGGDGSNTVGNDKKANLGDALSSQGSVEVAGKFVFVVNSGSNSVSMFVIDPQDPTKLAMVGKPAVTTGEFPTSVAPSLHLGIVCVAHTGVKAGISCAKFSKKTGIDKFDTLRPFDLKQTNPPSGPLNGIGDTFFTEDSSALVTLVKGDPTKNDNGFISIFTASLFQEGIVSTTGIQTSPPGTTVLFGAAQIRHTTKILATDASFGAVVIDLADLKAQPKDMLKIEGQSATCWAKMSHQNHTIGFVTDVGVNSLTSINTKTGKQIQSYKSKNANKGMIDFVVAGEMVYALSPGKNTDGNGASIAAFNVSNPADIKDMQNIAIKGADGNAQGMAVLM